MEWRKAPKPSLSPPLLDRRPQFFDRIHVWRIRWQKQNPDRMISQVLSQFAGMMQPSIVEDQHVVFVQLRPQLLQPLQHLVALERAFKTPGRKDLFSTHRRDKCLFPGLGSLMVEVLHRFSHGGSGHLADPVIVDSRFVAPKELWVPAAIGSTPR